MLEMMVPFLEAKTPPCASCLPLSLYPLMSAQGAAQVVQLAKRMTKVGLKVSSNNSELKAVPLQGQKVTTKCFLKTEPRSLKMEVPQAMASHTAKNLSMSSSRRSEIISTKSKMSSSKRAIHKSNNPSDSTPPSILRKY